MEPPRGRTTCFGWDGLARSKDIFCRAGPQAHGSSASPLVSVGLQPDPALSQGNAALGTKSSLYQPALNQRGKWYTYMMQFLQSPCSQAGLLLYLSRCQGLSTLWVPPQPCCSPTHQACKWTEGSNSFLEHSERVCWSLLQPSDAADSAKTSLLLTEQPSSHKGALCWGQLLWRWGGTWPSELLCPRGQAGGCAQVVFASKKSCFDSSQTMAIVAPGGSASAQKPRGKYSVGVCSLAELWRGHSLVPTTLLLWCLAPL